MEICEDSEEEIPEESTAGQQYDTSVPDQKARKAILNLTGQRAKQSPNVQAQQKR